VFKECVRITVIVGVLWGLVLSVSGCGVVERQREARASASASASIQWNGAIRPALDRSTRAARIGRWLGGAMKTETMSR